MTIILKSFLYLLIKIINPITPPIIIIVEIIEDSIWLYPPIQVITVATVLLNIWIIIDGTIESVFTATNANNIPSNNGVINWTKFKWNIANIIDVKIIAVNSPYLFMDFRTIPLNIISSKTGPKIHMYKMYIICIDILDGKVKSGAGIVNPIIFIIVE